MELHQTFDLSELVINETPDQEAGRLYNEAYFEVM